MLEFLVYILERTLFLKDTILEYYHAFPNTSYDNNKLTASD